MKSNYTLSIVAALGIAAVSSASAQERPQFGPPPFVRELPTAFAILAAADENQNGTLEEAEQATLVAAIEDGTITRPKGLPTPPAGIDIQPSDVVARLAKLYKALAPFDADADGLLSEAERSAIRDAIRNGDLEPPMLMMLPKEAQERMKQRRGSGRRPRGRR